MLKQTLKKALYGSMSNELVLGAARKKMLRGKVVVLMYHELAGDDDEIEAWTIVRRSDFVRQMEYLSAHFEVTGVEEAVNGKDAAGRQKPLAVVTFDDGYAGNRKILLPLMKSMGLPVTVFVSTGAVISRELYWYDRIITAAQSDRETRLDLTGMGMGSYNLNRTRGPANWAETQRLLADLKELQPLERDTAVAEILNMLKGDSGASRYSIGHLTQEEIKEMSASPLVTFGAHSHCHGMLPQLTAEGVKESVMNSKLLLEKWTGKEVKYFAYPSGAYDAKVMNVLKEGGFKGSFTTKSKPWDAEALLEIPRIGVGRYDSFDHFKIRVSNALALF